MGTVYAVRAMELEPGRRVGDWRIEQVVGRGAMATVHRVRHAVLGTVAALKVLDRADPSVERRLVEEGRAQASVAHPGVVGVLDLLRVDDHAALLLEYVDGADLAARLAEAPLPREVALDVFRQVVAAVAHAHAAGLVHRDLKPSNVLVADTAAGLVAKVGDFGLVKSDAADLTLTHALVGTPRYMAPEQMRAAREVDARADVFALGCLLYELVAHAPPFTGHDLVALYGAKMSGAYPPLPADTPAPVARAIAGALQGSLSARIPSCRVLLDVLDGAPFAAAPDATFDGNDQVAICPSCGAAGGDDPCATCGAPLLLCGRFRLIAPVSTGPVTRVWRAVDLRDGGFVAARALAGTVDAEVRARFDRGAQVLAELSHPQIARAIGPAFDEHGARWEIRGWVEGASLAERVARERLSVAEVRAILLDLVAPLRYLAERSPPVVHRAVSADNVVQTPDGRCVLVDFAQVRDRLGDGSLHDVPYGAPEQWVGEATPATDVFGLGALGISLLARVPAHQLWKGDRIVLDAVPAGPTRRLLGRMVAFRPEDRPGLAEVAAALTGEPPAPSTDPRARQVAFAAIAFSVVVTAVVVTLSAALLPFGSVLAMGWLMLSPSHVTSDGPAPVAAWAEPVDVGPPPVVELREPGADLAERPVPGADCGSPSTQILRVLGPPSLAGAPVPLYLRTRCEAVSLGTARVGEVTTVTLPADGVLAVPWVGARCGTDPDRTDTAGSCARFTIGAATADREVIVSLADEPARVEVVYDDGRPVASARVSMGYRTGAGGNDEGWTLPHTAPIAVSGGVAVFPVGLRRWEGALVVEVDGVYRRAMLRRPSGVRGWTLTVADLDSVAEVVVVDPAGKPVADAELSCQVNKRTQTLPPDFGAAVAGNVYPTWARTDAGGHARCDLPGAEPPGDWIAVVHAPGFVPATSTLLPPTTRVTLAPSVTLRVGCAGLPNDRCDSVVDGLRCDAGGVPAAGACVAGYDGVVSCACDIESDGVAHPILGRATRIAGRSTVWLDVRGVSGSVYGSSGCEMSLEANGAALHAPIDASGAFVFRHVPAGGYDLRGLCKNRTSIVPSRVRVEDAAVRVDPEGGAPVPMITVRPEPEPAPAAAGVEAERELVDYAFPAKPEGAPSRQCSVVVTIDPSGAPTDAVPVRGCPEDLVAPAVAAVKRWRWRPGAELTHETLVVPFR